MDALYLIAHKVYGEPAFDVASQIPCPECNGDVSHDIPKCAECDELGHWWIIPTSGHRAFPYWHVELINNGSLIGLEWCAKPGACPCPCPMPDPWPDHYPEPSPAKVETQSLLAVLGLAKPKPQVKRRV